MFWGTPTSSIDWCERNYAVSPYVAEFWNTITNSLFVFVGLFGAYLKYKYLKSEKRFIVLDLFVAIIGLGSAAFHGTMLFSTQLFDELPMVWCSLIQLFVLLRMQDFKDDKQSSWSLILDDNIAKVLVVFGIVWTANAYWIHRQYNIAFQLFFIATTAYGFYLMSDIYHKTNNIHAKRLLVVYFASLGLAGTFWLTDNTFCKEIEDTLGHQSTFRFVGSFHGYWHILMAVNAYCGSLFVTLIRSELWGKKPTLKFCGGIMPYVVGHVQSD